MIDKGIKNSKDRMQNSQYTFKIVQFAECICALPALTPNKEVDDKALP